MYINMNLRYPRDSFMRKMRTVACLWRLARAQAFAALSSVASQAPRMLGSRPGRADFLPTALAIASISLYTPCRSPRQTPPPCSSSDTQSCCRRFPGGAQPASIITFYYFPVNAAPWLFRGQATATPPFLGGAQASLLHLTAESVERRPGNGDVETARPDGSNKTAFTGESDNRAERGEPRKRI